MRRRRVWVAAAAALGVLAIVAVVLLSLPGARRHHPPPRPAPSPSPAPPSPSPSPAPVQLGASVNRLFNDRTYDPAQIASQLQALRAAGAALARSDSLWELAEAAGPTGSAHHFDWSFDDQIVGDLAAHGLRWLPILDYSAPWARLHPQLLHSPPASAGAFAAFAAALAARYGPGGTFWRIHPGLTPLPVQTYEVWNEPDNGEFWQPAPDPAAYADLYLAARAAIAGVEPGANVVVGGLTKPSAFLPALLHARPQLAGSLDAVAIHPYGPTPDVVLERVRQARAVLSSLGLAAVPLYVTEFGWTTHPPGALGFAPESLRPSYITRTLAALGHTDCHVAAVLLYTWVTPERDPANKEDWYGVSPPGGGASPDAAAFAAGVRAAAASAPSVPLCAT